MTRRPTAGARPAWWSVGSVVSALVVAVLLTSCASERAPVPRDGITAGLEAAVQGTVGTNDPLLPMTVSPVEVLEGDPSRSFDVEVGDVVDVPVRALWRVPGLDTQDREATDVVTLRREVDGWSRLSAIRLPWGVSHPVTRTSPRCRVVGPAESAAVVVAVHSSCERSVPAVVDVWPGWDGAAVIVVSSADLEPGVGARVEGSVSDGQPAPADRMVVDRGAAAELGETGLDVLLRHELVHVAMRATGSAPVPLWVQEGLAVHVGYATVGDERSRQQEELRRLLARRQDGRWSGSVPDEAAFEDPATREHAYVAARLGVEVLMDSAGRQHLLTTLAPGAPGAGGAAGGDATEEEMSPRPVGDERRTQWLLSALGRSSNWLDREWALELERRVEGGSWSR